ncbi:hypothetical protein SAMN02927916_3386 [Flavobacterium anhuiense]|uniref:Bacterial surface antigen (D15) domain-containing protein n=1 Tax=Flavobacterium anhuiense TaxID=459526 RepID=A0ABY0LYE8_9FLAO|nr:hypothetical protein [Flavobacterium anhuiense]SCY78732.1 hypothetical protein SAMN02927916_3386 [Flavobacterium anhuiense]
MKNLFLIVLFFFSLAMFGQKDSTYMKSMIKKYYDAIRDPKEESDNAHKISNDFDNEKFKKSIYVPKIISFKELETSTSYIDARVRQKSNKNNKILLTPSASNAFFASEVSSYVTSSKDLTFQKAYAVLNTADKTLFLGGTFDTRDKETDAVSHLITTGIKAKVDDDFSAIYKNGKLQNDLGVSLKYHYIWNGSIYYEDEQQEEKINSFRVNVIEKLVNESIYDNPSDNKAEIDFYKKIAEEEIDYLRKFRLYSLSTDYWISIETYMPVSPRQYELLPDISTTESKKENFYPWYITAGFTKYWKWSSGQSCYISGFGNVKNNNNIETEALTKYTLPIYSPDNSSLIEDNKTVYGGDFKQFITPSLSAEFVSFFVLEGTFGFSSGVDKTFGEYDTLNWKLGIPFSLKDKDEKPSVNFEVVWKEVNKDHFVGINVGFTFGKFIQ